MAGLFTFIFTKGYEGKPGIGEGIRYGLWIGLLLYVPTFITGLVFAEWSASLQTIRMLEGILESVVCGAVLQENQGNRSHGRCR